MMNVDIDECIVNNGGCDPLTNCTNQLGGVKPLCTDCPDFYSGNGATGCLGMFFFLFIVILFTFIFFSLFILFFHFRLFIIVIDLSWLLFVSF